MCRGLLCSWRLAVGHLPQMYRVRSWAGHCWPLEEGFISLACVAVFSWVPLSFPRFSSLHRLTGWSGPWTPSSFISRLPVWKSKLKHKSICGVSYSPLARVETKWCGKMWFRSLSPFSKGASLGSQDSVHNDLRLENIAFKWYEHNVVADLERASKPEDSSTFVCEASWW